MSQSSQGPAGASAVVAPAAKDPSVRLFILAAMLIGFGAWAYYDHYILGKHPSPEGDINELFSYYLNHYGAIVFPLVGLVPLVWGIVRLGRKLVADEKGIGYQGKAPIPWSAVTSLDSRDLGKGFLRIHHKADDRAGVLVLDSWKIRNFKDLVAKVEQQVPPAARGQS